MKYKIISPPPDIKEHVIAFWSLEVDYLNSDILNCRLFSDNCPGIVFHYHNQFKLDSLSTPILHLHGQTTKYRDLKVKGNFGICGAYLYPSSLKNIFNLPSPEASNEIIDINMLLRNDEMNLQDQLINCQTNDQRFNVLSFFLRSRIKKKFTNTLSLRPIIDRILQKKANFKIDELVHLSGLSQRQFERVFNRDTGMSPKLFCRVMRFRSSLKLSHYHNLSLTDIALQSGYFDQSHFIRDFREFSGMSPTEYFKRSIITADNFVGFSN